MRTFTLICFFIVGLGSSAASAKAIAVDFAYSRFGVSVCASRVVVTPKDTYLVCSSELRGKQTFLKLKAEAVGTKQFKISAMVDEIEPDGKIIEFSRPTIVALENESAEIAVGDFDGKNLMMLKVRAFLAE